MSLRTLRVLAVAVVLAGGAVHGESRIFTNRDGKAIRAELIKAGEEQIEIKAGNGKKYTLRLDQLSDADQEFIREKLAADEETAGAERERMRLAAAADTARQVILDFVKENLGEPVGDAECWTLADRAFQKAEIRRPEGQVRVWGRELDLENEEPLPGDIVEIEGGKFQNANGTVLTFPEQHTAVVGEVGRRGVLQVYEQNVNGKRFVTEGKLEIRALVSGSLKIYRYE